MLVTELSSYGDNDGLYNFNSKKDGWNFFFLDDVNTPFPKPPNNSDYKNDGLLAASPDTHVRILRIRCNTISTPQDNKNADVAAVDQLGIILDRSRLYVMGGTGRKKPHTNNPPPPHPLPVLRRTRITWPNIIAQARLCLFWDNIG